MVRKINKRSQCLRHRNLVAMVIFMAGIVIYLKSDLWLSSLTPTPQHHSTYRQINSSTLAVVSKNVTSDKISKRVILWYNAPSYVKRARNFKPTQLCPQLNCEYTTDRKRSTLSQVVIFDAHTLPKHPPNKLPHQKWVFFSQESPIAIKSENLNSNEWLFKFDLTATYRRDSDIPTPYGIIKARDGETPVIAKNYTDIFIRKKMAAVWMVSHCLTHSKRESLVQKLREFFPVDIFGTCGKRLCGRFNDSSCLKKKIEEYMFYLSFENALCKDYVTEKFYRYYKYDTIQIVRARINYSEIAPQGTFVDTADFKSVEQLGNYLKSLAQDEVTYTDYLKRKDAYASIFEEYQFPLTSTSYFTHSHYFKQPLCDLCQIDLSTTHAQSKYPDVYQWFQRDTCHTPEDIQ